MLKPEAIVAMRVFRRPERCETSAAVRDEALQFPSLQVNITSSIRALMSSALDDEARVGGERGRADEYRDERQSERQSPFHGDLSRLVNPSSITMRP